MKGLILKDFLSLKKQALPMLLFFGVYFFISIMTKNASFLTGVVMIFCAMLPMTALSYDDRAGFSKYALTMPVSRSTLVISKYVMALILMGFGSIFSLLLNAVIGSFSFMESLWSVAMTMLIGCLMVSISLPPIFKYGIEKGRFIMIGIVMIIGFLGGFTIIGFGNGNASMTIDNNGVSLGSKIDAFFNSNMVFVGILVISAFIFLLSMSISLAIYRKKDF
ncbi:ABC-2 transporter permease [Aminipila terrae]|uniref:ABC-2 transporter permease n=1 Tax=Aminipila terrae TaxID=2697030 RepID=A0A6P1ML72_9FIRM|nr:ABC-2 transporter permease [Aminipila terrae]QHI72396.1 ABC-2 transporter permease [Aminipila terrae]